MAAWKRQPSPDWPPDDWLARDPPRWWGWTMAWGLLVFLLGGTAGYFARDFRAPPEVQRFTEDVRVDVERTASDALRRARQVEKAVIKGVRAAAESAKAVLN